MLNIVIPYGSAFLLGTSLATLFIKKILPISIIIGIITLALIYLIHKNKNCGENRVIRIKNIIIA